MTTRFIRSAVLLFSGWWISVAAADPSSAGALRDLAEQESLIPIRPGHPGKTPFWNRYATCFMYAPSFEFNQVDGAVFYRFIATAADSQQYGFIADTPWAALTPIWNKIPVGFVHLTAYGVNAQGSILGLSGTRDFYRAAVFRDQYHEPVSDYRSSAHRALEYLYRLPHIQHWKRGVGPDTTYALYCYPSKIMAAVIESMVLYAGLSPEHAADALQISRNAADHLIHISEPAGAALEFFPPTYQGEKLTAREYSGQYMLIYPAETAMAYLDLYDACRERKYLQAALRIADTYARLQLANGTWPLKMLRDGRSATENLCIPVAMIELFERLQQQYHIDMYQESKERAFRYVMEGPARTFNWEGQFEDVAASKPYRNLSKHSAASFAIFLFDHYAQQPRYLDLAKELVRFAEDQFVVWEKPMPQKQWRTDQWITPCVLEQYAYYVPIDASAAKLIQLFLTAGRTSGDSLYLAKARQLANAMTKAQDAKSGRYPTYWERNQRGEEEGWINCAAYDARVMLHYDAFLKRRSAVAPEKPARPARNEDRGGAAVLSSFVRSERRDYRRQMIQENIEYPFRIGLTAAGPYRWVTAFWAMELLAYRSEAGKTALQQVLAQFHPPYPSLQRAALETAYALYPREFSAEISTLADSTCDIKSYTVAMLYLLRNDNGQAHQAKLLSHLQTRFPEWREDAVLFCLAQDLSETPAKRLQARPSLSALLRHTFSAGGPIIFSFQRPNRDYPGLTVVKKPDGEFLRNPDGSLFCIPHLARSLSALPGYLTNGNTPQGVYCILGIEESKSDLIGPTPVLNLALPGEISPSRFFRSASVQDADWTVETYARLLPAGWRAYQPMYEAFYAGKAGRAEIVAHGSTVDPDYYRGKAYYPFTPSLGCLTAFEAWSNKDGRRLVSDQQALIQAYQAAGGSGGYLIIVEKDHRSAAVDREEIVMDLLAAEGY